MMRALASGGRPRTLPRTSERNKPQQHVASLHQIGRPAPGGQPRRQSGGRRVNYPLLGRVGLVGLGVAACAVSIVCSSSSESSSITLTAELGCSGARSSSSSS